MLNLRFRNTTVRNDGGHLTLRRHHLSSRGAAPSIRRDLPGRLRVVRIGVRGDVLRFRGALLPHTIDRRALVLGLRYAILGMLEP
jgi:hypothetical protein